MNRAQLQYVPFSQKHNEVNTDSFSGDPRLEAAKNRKTVTYENPHFDVHKRLFNQILLKMRVNR